MQLKRRICKSWPREPHTSCSRTGPSSRATPSALPASRPARPASRRDGGLRGGGHRPELRRAGADVQLPADRQLRRRRVADGVGARLDRGRRRPPNPARARAVAGGEGRRRARGRRHPRARPARSLGGGDALRPRRGHARRVARAGAGASRTSTTSARSPSPSWPIRRSALLAGTHEPYTVGAGPRVAVLDFGCKRSIIRRLAGAGLEVAVVPALVRRRRDSRAQPDGGARRQRPGRSRPAHRRDRDRAGPARTDAALRRLPRPPAARARPRPADVQAAVRPPRREPSRARPQIVPRPRHGPEPRLRRRRRRTPPRSATSRSTTARWKASRATGSSRSSSIPRRRPGRSTRFRSSTGSPRRPVRRRPSGPDPIRPGTRPECRNAPTFAPS